LRSARQYRFDLETFLPTEDLCRATNLFSANRLQQSSLIRIWINDIGKLIQNNHQLLLPQIEGLALVVK
tara:strand:- start:68 stop:274 length:207 start_codon:yes stop_codon:yes gene_type:complete